MNQDVKLTHREWVKKAWGFGTFLSTVVQQKAAHSPCSHTKLRCDLQSHPHKKHDRGTQKRKQAVVCPVMQGAHTVQYGHDQVMPCPAPNMSWLARGHNKCASKIKFYRARIKCPVAINTPHTTTHHNTRTVSLSLSVCVSVCL